MKILEVLLARPSLFFNLAGIRISDFDNLARQTYPLWLESEHNRLSYKGRKRAIGAGRKPHLHSSPLSALRHSAYGGFNES